MEAPSYELRETCERCKLSKVKCDKELPKCGRCTRLNVPCNPRFKSSGGGTAKEGSANRTAGGEDAQRRALKRRLMPPPPPPLPQPPPQPPTLVRDDSM